MDKTTPEAAAELAALLADAPDASDHERVRKYVHALAEAGCSVLFVLPGTKVPADMRTARKCNADDRAAREVAGEAGQRNWAKVKSPAGVHLATSDTAVLDGYLDRYGELFGDGVAVNLAVSLGRSRLVVVDCDTAGQMAAFLAEAGLPADTDPTVRTPGQRDPRTGEMVHRDGGHFYFTVPEGVELPERPESMTTGEHAYAVLWGPGKYVLIPPSVRAEGLYTAVSGGVHELPEWLCDRITRAGQGRAERLDTSTSGDGPLAQCIDAWAESVSWADILEPLGWTLAARPDACGCEVWTAPGDHGSPKSATAHDSGCAAGIYSETNAPLHIWTDHDRAPFDAWLDERGTSTLSKLQAVAVGHYGNDMGAAMDALDLRPDLSVDFTGLRDDACPDRQTYSDPVAGPSVAEQADELTTAKDALAAVMRENLDLFDASEILSGLAAFADARKVGRYALLGGVLVRVITALPYTVVLPATIAAEVSLNLLLAQCGVPGSGKGGSDKAAAEAAVMRFGNYTVPRLVMTPVGTGEGINRTYATAVPIVGTRRSETVFHDRSALFSVRDIVTLETLANRSGSTIIGELLKAYMGEELGFGNAGKDTRVILPENSYRLGLLMGVQPDRASVLLDAVARGNGLTTRILALPVTDLRERSGTPQRGTPVTLALPADLWRNPLSDDPTTTPLDVPASIAETLIAAQNAKNLDVFGASDDPMAGHRGLSQLKLAAAFGTMHGSTSTGGSYWQLAGRLAEVSDAMMGAMFAASRQSEAIVAGEQGTRDGYRRAAADDTLRLVMVGRVRERVLTVLRQRTDWTPHGTVANAVSTPQRFHLAEALADLLGGGGRAALIEAESHEYKGQTIIRYRIAAR